MPRAFVIRPFKTKTDSAGNTLDFERVHEDLIGPALEASGLHGATTGEIVEPGNIREDMFSLLIEADVVICDITVNNANVFYELGIRHALRKKRTVMIKGAPSADSTPFDILTDRYVPYDTTAPGKALDDLTATVQAALATERETDSPIFKMLPGLPEADPSTVQFVPLGFREDVDRARAAGSKGWLRLLSYEVRGRRFERVALQMIADALWKLNDYTGARECLELIRETAPDDEAANLSLSNVYERLYRTERLPQLLTSSDQAIERVLASKTLAPKGRAEALALKGRNRKTRWRGQLDGLDDVARYRSTAMNEMLRQAYGAYRDAFRQDLNHFYSGLAALQMGVIFLDLAKDEGWTASFDTDDEANEYRRKLESEVPALKLVVESSVDAALQRLGPTDPERIWAAISKTDLVFLTEDNAARVRKRYLDVIPSDNLFAADSATGQLKLFASLGVRAEIARQAIDAIEARGKDSGKPAAIPTGVASKPAHVVVFAGHCFDEANRPSVRFPAALEQPAYQAIRKVLSRLNETDSVVGFSSVAPGADIVFHEACRELGIPSMICLPMRADRYVSTKLQALQWRSRALALIQDKKLVTPPGVVELNDAPGLPKWLQGSDTNEWERGNRWTLEMAVTRGAPKVTVVAVWDERPEGDGPGGTAHMVALARERADVNIEVIPTSSLMGAAPV